MVQQPRSPKPDATGGGRGGTQLAEGAVGLPAVLMQSLTHVAPAAGAVVSIQFIVQLVGLSTPLAFLIAFGITLMLAVTLTQLAKHLPSAGGYYTYVSHTVGPRTGFLTAWVYFLYDPIQGGMLLAFGGWFMTQIMSSVYNVSVPWLWPVFLVFGTVSIAALMYKGIKISGKVLFILGSIEIVIFLALAFTGFLHAGPGGMGLGVFNPQNAHGGLFLAVVFSIFAFTGFEACIPLAEEAHNPKRTVPIAIVGSALIGGVFYLVVSWGVLTGWGTDNIGTFASSVQNPILVTAKHLWGGASILIVLAFLNSILGAVFAGNNAATRVFFGMGRSGALPRALAKVSPHTKTPTNAITMQAVLTLVVGFTGSLLLGPDRQLFLLATVLTLGLIFVYIAGNLGVFLYYWRVRRSEFNWLLHFIFPVLASAALIVVGYKSVVPLPAFPVSLAPFIAVGWLVVGVIVVLVLSKSGRAEWLTKAADVLATEEVEPHAGHIEPR